ncbi:Uncharacterised protein [Serratia quinivorans]|nr:Uncharacterised protein [Serratia quinivorans]CAI1055723.1 Uncharacterised protein [Serratia quinivorans]CAI1136102.1 Uncharacterised protein [Serratia quinivorans]CAI1142859.1 Uncharacterised protein [Serratia quinivorans]CAI1216627.1 Uncharacterised protein [Serratia quinivorans]
MKILGVVICWCTVLILIVSWFMYIIYDYSVTN